MDDLDKNGFFVLEDGSKSSDHKAKLKKRAKDEKSKSGKVVKAAAPNKKVKKD